MGAYINRTETYTTTGPQNAIPLNRWTTDDYTVAAQFVGAGDVSFEGTITKFNRIENFGEPPATAVWFPIASSQLTADGAINVVDTPLEGIRANIASIGTSITVQVMQQGESY